MLELGHGGANADCAEHHLLSGVLLFACVSGGDGENG